jgi:uncharacterized protein YbaR (Trm112 family)
MKKKLLTILMCPQCKGKLIYTSRKNELICEVDKLVFPIRNGIPILLISDSKPLDK